MKTIAFFVLFCLMAGISVTWGQTPEGINYQVVARDTNYNLLTDHSISLRLTILRDSNEGLPVFSETHALTTNHFGLASVYVGRGTLISGDFTLIEWGSHRHFLQTELDPDGGTNFQLMGISELLSVPYALYAKRAAPSHVAGEGIGISGDTVSNALPNALHTGDAVGESELSVVKLKSRTISDLPPENGYTYKWNATALEWEPAADENTTYTAGSGLELAGTVFSNTSPDIIVSLTPANAIGITGSYPDFSIENTAPDQTVTLTPGIAIGITGAYPDFTIDNSAPDKIVVMTSGPGINVFGSYPIFTVSNTKPDQVVIMSNGTGISVSGGYPSFTITNTSPDQTVSISSGTGINVSGSYPNFTVTNTSTNATHTGDATGNAALSVVKIQGRDVAVTVPSTNQVLKWNGSSWTPAADATRDGCPSGYTSVNAEYCIETGVHDWNYRTWFDAVDVCGDNGAHLCSWAEWYYACANTGGLSYMLGYWQWTDDAVSATTYARVAGGGTCIDRDNLSVTGTNALTRCCFGK